MASQLDNVLSAIMDEMVKPGQIFETTMVEQYGVEVPAFKNAPPTLAHYFAHFCGMHKDLVFLVDGETRLTFGETWAAATQVAAGLAQNHGVKRGDKVGIAARNSANWVITYMGVILAGGCATLVNGFWSGAEMAYGIDLAECSLLLADEERAARLNGHAHKANLVLFAHDGPPSTGLAPIWGEGNTAMEMLGQLSGDDMATILYTSGSTGKSKAAWSDHRGVVQGTMNYASQSAMVAAYMTKMGTFTGEQPSTLIAVPLFHVTGEVPLFLQSFALGRKVVLMPKWEAREAMRLMAEEKVSYFAGVPLMTYEMASHPDRDLFDLSALKGLAAGGAPRPVEHVTKLRKAFPDGFPLLGYGLTETNAVGCGNINENYMAKPSSTGRASRPLVDLAILDDDGNVLPQGERGEVCLRTIANFKGYYRNDEATAAAFTKDGYFRSGDIGYLDEDGYLYIVDRKKDIIIRGGENISCIEVEEAIYAHDSIAECSVFGLPEERYGEIPATVYFCKAGQNITKEELRAFLLAHIAPFQVPALEHIWQSDAPLVRLGTQKIDKRTVRTQFAGDLAGA